MEKLGKVEIDYNPRKHIYFLKQFDDGVYICRADWNRKGRNKKVE